MQLQRREKANRCSSGPARSSALRKRNNISREWLGGTRSASSPFFFGRLEGEGGTEPRKIERGTLQAILTQVEVYGCKSYFVRPHTPRKYHGTGHDILVGKLNWESWGVFNPGKFQPWRLLLPFVPPPPQNAKDYHKRTQGFALRVKTSTIPVGSVIDANSCSQRVNICRTLPAATRIMLKLGNQP